MGSYVVLGAVGCNFEQSLNYFLYLECRYASISNVNGLVNYRPKQLEGTRLATPVTCGYKQGFHSSHEALSVPYANSEFQNDKDWIEYYWLIPSDFQ